MVFLPDTVLVVPGAAGRADPGAGLRAAALAAVRAAAVRAEAAEPAGTILVVAPGHRDRDLPHPVATGLGAAGLPENEPRATSTRADAALGRADDVTEGRADAAPGRAGVAASVALVLLRAAGVDAPVDVVEIARTPTGVGHDARALRAFGRDRAASVTLLVAVGSLSARHGPDAPLADDPRAPVVDDRLLAALADGPAALAGVLAEVGAAGAGELAVSGWAPWQVALGALGYDTPGLRAAEPGSSARRALPGAPAVSALSAMPAAPAVPAPPAVLPVPVVAEVIAGAQHAVAAWLPVPTPASEESR